MLQPVFKTLPETRLVGHRTRLSVANNTTAQLWQGFMPKRHAIAAISNDFYSVEVYDDLSFFDAFDPQRMYEKWAAVAVAEDAEIPAGMEVLVVPGGLYAVFTYKGTTSNAMAFYQAIYSGWVPNAGYELADRPHMAIMGEKYKRDHPDSEEEIWVPVLGKGV